MRILMFGWEFPPHITGGLGTACYGLSKSLAKQDVNLLFVVPKKYGDEHSGHMELKGASSVLIKRNKNLENEKEFRENLTYLEIVSNLIPYMSPEEFHSFNTKTNTFSIKGILETGSDTNFTFSGEYGTDIFNEVAKYAVVSSYIAKDNNFDVIHAHDWLTYPAGIIAKQISGKPLVVHIHATEFDRSGEHINQNVYDIERKGFKEADKIITVSNMTRDIVINRYGINPDKVTTVYNGVDNVVNTDYEFKKGVNEKIVTFLGRVTFQKGPDYFVEAAYKVLQKNKNVRFVMAGSGDMLNRMIKRVAELGISTKFHFTGFLKGDEVYKMYSATDVYVMPSVSEPFGISPLEAMKSNVPVIISKQSGVAEILNHAIKVDFWDIDSLADAIYGLIQYNGLSNTFKKHGKQEVDNLKWDNAASKVINIYNDLMIK